MSLDHDSLQLALAKQAQALAQLAEDQEMIDEDFQRLNDELNQALQAAEATAAQARSSYRTALNRLGAMGGTPKRAACRGRSSPWTRACRTLHLRMRLVKLQWSVARRRRPWTWHHSASRPGLRPANP